MVKFNQKLAANIVPEWSGYYMDYTALKKRIKEAARSLDRRATTGVLSDIRTSLLQRAPSASDVAAVLADFSAAALAEARKVEDFYRLRVRHAQEEWLAHAERLSQLAPAEPFGRSESDSDAPFGASMRGARVKAIGQDDETRESLQSAVRELYRCALAR